MFTPKRAVDAPTIPLECGVITADDHTDYAKNEEYTTLACRSAGGVLGRWNDGEFGHPMPCCTTPESGNGTFHSVCEALHGHIKWWRGPPRGKDDHCITQSNTTTFTPERAVDALLEIIPLSCGVTAPTDAYVYDKAEEYTMTACRTAGGVLGRWDGTDGGIRGWPLTCCNTPASGNDTFYSVCEEFGDRNLGRWPRQLKESEPCKSWPN